MEIVTDSTPPAPARHRRSLVGEIWTALMLAWLAQAAILIIAFTVYWQIVREDMELVD